MDEKKSLFEAAGSAEAGTICILLDRMFDPYTPIVTQFRYIAAAHELVGLENNSLSISQNSPSDARSKVCPLHSGAPKLIRLLVTDRKFCPLANSRQFFPREYVR